ncbi:putative PurR-regulated permease PerM [Sphingobium sp. B1D3A]|uniref:PurR-regulated permease PerM n=2 Tax=Sphingobium lignivorans TaxID=2735886 RepID=A0ABR6NA34_9SPHN|nr:putative PurR-regulated permease PerM [Sphingobium lignivorans]
MRVEDGFFLGLVLLVTVAFALLIEPFFVAILWGVIAAILFTPVYHRLLAAFPRRPNTSAAITLVLIVAMVIVPAILLSMALIQEATLFYGRIQSGEIDFAMLFSRLRDNLPDWAVGVLERLGFADFEAARARLNAGIADILRVLAAQAVVIGQGAFSFLIALSVMLYLTFFLLRDGDDLSRRLMNSTPLRLAQREALLKQFVLVIRATIKGSIVVAILQGLIGGLVFWVLGVEGALLWGVLMGFFSLLPAIGTGLVWVPVSIYLFVSGAIVKSIILVLCGLFVIGLVDNLLRPILVGRDTRLPDYVVLISTLGGIELFGFSGVVIGPVIAALFIATWTIVSDMRAPEQSAMVPGDAAESSAGSRPVDTL